MEIGKPKKVEIIYPLYEPIPGRQPAVESPTKEQPIVKDPVEVPA